MKLLTERLKKREEERDKKDPDERGREHAREGRDADGPTARGARPCREHQRQDAEEAVIITARKRMEAPCLAASVIESPDSRAVFANSTIKMAFFPARPMSITMPSCV